jgi:hypothetical protein
MPKFFYRGSLLGQVTCSLGLAIILFAGYLCPTAGAFQGPTRVTLKSGLVLEGRIALLNAYITDVNAASGFDMNAPENVVMINDGMRRVFINKDRIANRPDDIVDARERTYLLTGQKGMVISESDAEGYASRLVNVSPFNEFGHRQLFVQTTSGVEGFVQAITAITPNATTVDTVRGLQQNKTKSWTMRLPTASIPADVLSQVMHREISDPDNPNDYWRIYEIFYLGDILWAAQRELDRIREKFPDQAAEVDDQQARIRTKQAAKILEEIRVRREVGQPKLARQLAETVTGQQMGDESRIAFQDVLEEIQKERASIDELRQTISKTVGAFLEQQATPESQQSLREFLNEIEQHLSLANYRRFDPFVRFLSDPSFTHEQRVAQVLSSWYLGSADMLNNYAVAESLHPVYNLVRQYLSPNSNPAERLNLLEQIKKYEGGAPEYVAAMLRQMTPVHAPDVSKYNGESPMTFKIEMPDFQHPAAPPLSFNYHVHLPPEYDPYKKYPLLVTLPPTADAAAYMTFWVGDFDAKLNMRNGLAARNGYITISLEWMLPGQTIYGYSTREHLACLRTIRQCFRQFSIDTDRVFIAGHGAGAEAAYDLGVSHPHLFAGVIGISGPVAKFAEFYNQNKLLGLAVYSVVGHKDRYTTTTSIKSWNNWLQNKKSSFDLLLVEYIGRLGESFYEEAPKIFEWMSVQQRRWPNRTEDVEIECKTLRPWTCQFWFVEYTGLPEENMVPPEFWIESGYNPFKIGLQKKGNRLFNISPAKQGNVTISLSPEFIDLNEQIEIKGRGDFKGFIAPSLSVLLEDTRTRGDRLRPYWAKIKHEGRKWQIVD